MGIPGPSGEKHGENPPGERPWESKGSAGGKIAGIDTYEAQEMSHGMKDFGTRRLLTCTSVHIAPALFLHGFQREIDSCMVRPIIVPSFGTRVALLL